MSAMTLARRVAAAGVERIIYTDVQRDGMLTGVNIDQTRLIAATSALKITASGGVASLADLERLGAVRHCRIDRVIVGKSLYGGCLTLPETIAARLQSSSR